MHEVVDREHVQAGPRQRGASSGFSLLEVVITLSILVSLIFAITLLLRSSFDVRLALSQEARVTQRLNTALGRLSQDIGHAFLVSSKDQARTQGQRRTVFKIDKHSKADTLSMTYMGHDARKANAKEGDMAYVVYEVKASEKFPHRTNLYRGELPRVPSDVARLKEPPPMQLIAENIEGLQIEPWKGDDWLADKWDSNQGESDNALPSMVRVTIRAWAEDPIAGVEPDQADEVLVQYATVVYLQYSDDFNEIKAPVSSFKL